MDVIAQDLPAQPATTFHAAVRMQQRRVSTGDIDLALRYGRIYQARGAEIFVVGQREIRKYRQVPEMTPALDGLHVVCSGQTGEVITVYRNREFKRSSFDAKRRGRPLTTHRCHRLPSFAAQS